MARGHKTGGRRKGTPNKSAARRVALVKAATAGLTPLDFLLSIMRNGRRSIDARMEAAKAAAPFVHARFMAISIPEIPRPPIEVDAEACTIDHARRIAFTLGVPVRAAEKETETAEIIELKTKAA